ncbi:unnamed protein product [Penicillium glandicola]
MSDSIFFTAHRALALPEILGEILLWINDEEYRACRLLKCALVNKTWFREAIRLLWGDMEEPLDEAMIKIPPDRRQTYANLVKSAIVSTYNQDTESKVQPALENVVFPQLHTLSLVLVFHDSDAGARIRIPTLNMPNLQTVYVDRWVTSMYLYPDQWDYLTDRIPKLFPKLLNVRIEIPTILYIAGFEDFSENLPYLQSIEFEEVLSLSDMEQRMEDTYSENPENEALEDGDTTSEYAHSENTD